LHSPSTWMRDRQYTMCCDRPVLKAFRAVAVAFADYSIDKAENRLQSLADRLKHIRHEFVLDLQVMRLTTVMMSDAELEFDAFAEAVKNIAIRELDVRPQAIAEEGERVAVKVERMLVLK